MSILIAGIHTGIGKTLCSAVMVQALGYDYWKPVQAGDLNHSDSHFIDRYTSGVFIHKESYLLQEAASPHSAAAAEGIEIMLSNLHLPSSSKPIIVETAGGIMSPLSTRLLNTDLIKFLNLPVVLVIQDYLGSINHSLLSLQVLEAASIPLLGLVFNGTAENSSRQMILSFSRKPLLFSIPQFEKITRKTITDFADSISPDLKKKFDGFSTAG